MKEESKLVPIELDGNMISKKVLRENLCYVPIVGVMVVVVKVPSADIPMFIACLSGERSFSQKLWVKG